METTLYQSNAFMTAKVNACIGVVQHYIIPDSGISPEAALSEIIGLLDNAEIVEKLAASKALIAIGSPECSTTE